MLTRPNPIVIAFFALLLACLVALPFFTGPYPVKLMTRIVILATFVLSLDLLIGVTGLVSFGHAAFFGCGAYAVYFVSPESEAANVLVALGAGLLAGGVAAFVVGAFATLTRGFYFIMVTLAAGQMLFALFHDTDIAKGSDGAYINIKPDLTVFGMGLLDFSDRRQFYYVCLAVLVGAYFLLYALVRSPFGRVLQGIRANEVRMSSLGYNPYRYKLAAFTLAGMLAGLAGALFASIDGFVTPDLLNWHQSGLAIMMVVLGGAGTLFGPILGALAYASLEELLKTASIVGPFVADHWRLGTGATLIIAVLMSPDGLAGLLNWKRKRPDQVPARPVDVEPQQRPARVAKVLSTEGLSKNFNGVIGVSDVSVRFEANMVHAIIGPNGAGKTTFTNLLSGALPATKGSVQIDDLDVTGWPAHRIARAGLGRSYQRTNIFPRFTVRENCALAAQAFKDALWRLRDGPYRAQEDAAVDRALSVLMTGSPMGLLERCHAYKDKKARGLSADAGLFAYPVLMAADILIYDSDVVPVGDDQVQHIEVCRDLAAAFNYTFGETFVLPKAKLLDNSARVPGVDGEKMSKSYDNTIEVFEDVRSMRKAMRIKTDSRPMEQPKDPETDPLFQLYSLFASPEERDQMAALYRRGGFGYGEVKKALADQAERYFAEARERRQQFEAHPDRVRQILGDGAATARQKAAEVLHRAQTACGVRGW